MTTNQEKLAQLREVIQLRAAGLHDNYEHLTDEHIHEFIDMYVKRVKKDPKGDAYKE